MQGPFGRAGDAAPRELRCVYGDRLVAAKRALAERMREDAGELTRAAVNQLTRRAGLSVRDAAEMLGISCQRVQQLAGGG